MTEFTYVELFAGIGGFRSGLDQVGGECVFASEWDKFAQQSYTALYGKDHLHGDITKIPTENIPDHDLLVGGFPCPSFSISGNRDGMEYECNDCGHEHLITFSEYKNGISCPKCGGVTKPKDDRGVLFFEIARVADAKKPKAILMENVKGLISSSNGEVMRIIVQTMNEIGYTVDFDVLDSKFFNVPQHRERVFITAVRDDFANQSEWIIEGTNVVAKGKRRISGYDNTKSFNFDWPEQTEVTTRLLDILESDVDEKYYMSDEKTAALVAQLESQIDGLFIDPSQAKREGKPRVYEDIAPTLTARDYKEPRMIGRIEKLGMLDFKGNKSCREVYGVDGICPALTTMQGGHREPKTAVLENQRYRIRKLTPLECWRLQGFTDEQFYKAKYYAKEEAEAILRKYPNHKGKRVMSDEVRIERMSDTQLYKQAGNAVSVPVIKALGERLLTYL